jgi:hypothetical protein
MVYLAIFLLGIFLHGRAESFEVMAENAAPNAPATAPQCTDETVALSDGTPFTLQSCRSGSDEDHPMAQDGENRSAYPQLALALAKVIGLIVNECASWNHRWSEILDTTTSTLQQAYPAWSVAALKNPSVIEGCVPETHSFNVCFGRHTIHIMWGKHDRKCWFRRNGDGGWTNWNMRGDWTRRDDQAWVGY